MACCSPSIEQRKQVYKINTELNVTESRKTVPNHTFLFHFIY